MGKSMSLIALTHQGCAARHVLGTLTSWHPLLVNGFAGKRAPICGPKDVLDKKHANRVLLAQECQGFLLEEGCQTDLH